MKDAMNWWSKAYKEQQDGVQADKGILAESAEEMQEILQYGEADLQVRFAGSRSAERATAMIQLWRRVHFVC